MIHDDFRSSMQDICIRHEFQRDEIEAEWKYLKLIFTSDIYLGDITAYKVIAVGSYTFIVLCKKAPENDFIVKIIRNKFKDDIKARTSLANEHEILTILSKNAIREVARVNEVYRGKASSVIYALQVPYFKGARTLSSYLDSCIHDWTSETSSPLSMERIGKICHSILRVMHIVVSQILELHACDVFHLDIRPENILIESDGCEIIDAYLIDFGASFYYLPDKKLNTEITYSIDYSNIALLNSIDMPTKSQLETCDIFSVGKLFKYVCQILSDEFGKNLNSCYEFRYLETLALLLHGEAAFKFSIHDSPRFSRIIIEEKNIKTFDSLNDILLRHFEYDYFENRIEELANRSGTRFVNTGLGDRVPITNRVKAILEHPYFQRLKGEFQIGWIKEIFPNATHSRFSHSIGVYGASIAYFKAIIHDPENPYARILLDPVDIEHGVLYALLHDIGQSTFGHDFEVADGKLTKHEDLFDKILYKPSINTHSAISAIENKIIASTNPEFKNRIVDYIMKSWKNIDIARLKRLSKKEQRQCADGIILDILSSPIDADKYDYLQRDSIACGVPYGNSFDKERFLSSLTMWVRSGNSESIQHNRVNEVSSAKQLRHFALSYKAKAAPAVESLLLARYQMYSAIYWHHTFRAIMAMFNYCVKKSLGHLSTAQSGIYDELFYNWVIMGEPLDNKWLSKANIDKKKLQSSPQQIQNERALAFLWSIGNENTQNLLIDLSNRKIYKRLYEARIADLEIPHANALKTFKGNLILSISNQIQETLLTEVSAIVDIRDKTTHTVATSYAQAKLLKLKQITKPLILFDFPNRGVSDDANHPLELGDAIRKYSYSQEISISNYPNVCKSISTIQGNATMIRVFAEPDFHELIIRYLTVDKIKEICLLEILKHPSSVSIK